MGIYIKDMKMPTTCKECRYFIKTRNLIDLDYKYHCINGASALVFPNVYEYRAFDCPLTEVPEPHGRLIDADKVNDELCYESKMLEKDINEVEQNPEKYTNNYRIYSSYVLSGLSSAIISLDGAPTIIEGSK